MVKDQARALLEQLRLEELELADRIEAEWYANPVTPFRRPVAREELEALLREFQRAIDSDPASE